MTGSLINSIYGDAKGMEPEIGMGATVLSYTDRHAATVVSVNSTGKRVGVVYDKVTRTDGNGMSDAQTYSYAPGEGPTVYFTKRKNGRFVREGESMREGQKILIGLRDHYHDFSF